MRISDWSSDVCSSDLRGTGFPSDEDEMSAFDDCGRAHEAKFARDQEVEFRITARRNRLLGEWAAVRMGLTPEVTDAYTTAFVKTGRASGRDREGQSVEI